MVEFRCARAPGVASGDLDVRLNLQKKAGCRPYKAISAAAVGMQPIARPLLEIHMDYRSYVERAKAIAHEAHAGQTDKAGEPYINHAARVAAAVSDDPLAECVAWLHDVLEDCPAYALPVFLNFPRAITRPVELLTRDGFGAKEYYGFIRLDPVAIRVKLADIADNSDPERLAKLDPKAADRLRRKYAKALRMLGAA